MCAYFSISRAGTGGDSANVATSHDNYGMDIHCIVDSEPLPRPFTNDPLFSKLHTKVRNYSSINFSLHRVNT